MHAFKDWVHYFVWQFRIIGDWIVAGSPWYKYPLRMDSSNSSKENLSSSSLSVESIPNESESANNYTEVSIEEDNEKLSNDSKVIAAVDNKTESRNCTGVETNDTNCVEMVSMKDDIKNDVKTDESEKEGKESKEGKRKRKSTR